MSEFFNVLPPEAALRTLLAAVRPAPQSETVSTPAALDRVTAAPVLAPAPLPAFPRSTMDGYAVRARDTFGASASLPAFLAVAGEAPMGRPPQVRLGPGQAALIHTGGMLPEGADAVVMVENTQISREGEIEVMKAVAVGENLLRVGEDIRAGEEILPAGHWIRPQDLGGLTALGVMQVEVARRPRVAILASGDEVAPPEGPLGPGRVRDINSYTLEGLVRHAGGEPRRGGILPDDFEVLQRAARTALDSAEALVLSAGSSVSARDMTGQVIAGLGAPGVLVHGVAVKPGKPTILASAGGKPVFGLPGNPVSALVIADLFLTPTIGRLLGCASPPRRGRLRARLARNLASEAGREDYIPARLEARADGLWAWPVFGKSNLIFTLIRADGILKVPLDASGLAEGDEVEVSLF